MNDLRSECQATRAIWRRSAVKKSGCLLLFLAEIGLEPERLEMFNLSSAEGTRFAEIVTAMVERIKRLGSSPLRPDRRHLEQGLQHMSQQAETLLAGDQR